MIMTAKVLCLVSLIILTIKMCVYSSNLFRYFLKRHSVTNKPSSQIIFSKSNFSINKFQVTRLVHVEISLTFFNITLEVEVEVIL